MKRFFVFAALILAVPAASAYQVTGPVLEVTNDTIVVEKNKEKWEIQRDKDTKVAGELKKGSRVTVQYKMIATSIDSKDSKDKGSDKDAKGAGKDSKGAAKKDATPAKKEIAPAR